MPFETVLENVELGYRVSLYRNWLNREELTKLHQHLSNDVEFNVERIRGWTCLRTTVSYGNCDLQYTYSGRRQDAKLWTEQLETIKNKLDDSGVNFVLINRYPSGNAGIGWHADDEKDIVKDSTIYSLSLEDTRRFLLRSTKTQEIVLDIELPPGSLLTMEGATQKHLQHSVPATTAKAHRDKVRYNLTFRSIATK